MASAVVGALRVLLEVNASQLEEGFGKATITIGAFDKFTQNAGRNLQRMVEGFSGQKIVAEATTMAAAIEKIGGVSSLTERELRRVAGTVNEATDKLRAMGVDVPPSIAKVKAELDALGVKSGTATGAVNGLTGAFGKLSGVAGMLGVTLSAAAVARFGQQILADADAVTKLSDKTGIAVEAVQRLKYAAEQSGNTLDQVTSAITQMQNRLAEGDASAVGALRKLGLSFENIRNLAPDQQFAEIAREVATIEDPMERTRVAMDLFGRSGAEILPTIRADIKALGDEAPVMSEKAVAAFDAIGDAASRNWTRAKNAVGEGVSAAIDGYSRLFEISGALMTGSFSKVPEILLDLGTTAPKIAEPVNTMLKSVAENAKGVGMSMQEIDAASDSMDDAFKKGTKGAAAYAKALDTAEREQREFNNWIGERYVASEAARQDAAEKTETQLRNFYNWLGQRRMEDDAALMKSMELLASYTATWVPLKSAIEQTLPKMEDATQKQKRLQAASQDTSTSLRNLAQTIGALAQVAGDGGLGNFLQVVGNVVGSMSLARDATDQFKTGLDRLQPGSVASGLSSMAAGAISFAGAMMQVTQTTSKLQAALGGFVTGAATGNIFVAFASMLFGFARAQQNATQAAAALRNAMQQQKVALVDQLNALGNARFAWRELADEFERLMLLPTSDTTLRRMGEIVTEIQRRVNDTNRDFADLANDMIAAGYKIPAALQPVLRQLIELGVLSRENAELFGQLADGTNVDWRKMQEAAEKYGVNIDALGQGFQQLRLGSTAEELINAFDILTRGGTDAGTILIGMRDEIVKLIQDSIKFGTTIPENMRKWIEELERSGQLVDENGEKLWDLGALKFGQPIETEFERITRAIERLIETLDLLAANLKSLPKPDISVPNTTNPGFGSDAPGPVPYANGGLVTRPTLALLGERGPELVTPLRRYSNPRAVPIPNMSSIVPTVDDPRNWDTPRREDYRDDFREAVREMREDLKSWTESFSDSLAIMIRDAAMGAV